MEQTFYGNSYHYYYTKACNMNLDFLLQKHIHTPEAFFIPDNMFNITVLKRVSNTLKRNLNTFTENEGYSQLNNEFLVPVITLKHPGVKEKFKRVIILFHGLNERSWKKYLIWAMRLSFQEKVPVIMFPSAYHMNRAPGDWCSIHETMPIANERSKIEGNKSTISFINAMLSQRIDEYPERFILHGLQTVQDIEELLHEMREGYFSDIADDAKIDFFGYSIGCTIAEMLLIADYKRDRKNKLLNGTSSAFFCGGSILDKADPVSKTIIDAAAYSKLIALFDVLKDMKTDDCFVSDTGTTGLDYLEQYDLLSLIHTFNEYDYTINTRYICKNLLVIAMENDSVFPPESINSTFYNHETISGVNLSIFPGLKGGCHQEPFPVMTSESNKSVDDFFYLVFQAVHNHYMNT